MDYKLSEEHIDNINGIKIIKHPLYCGLYHEHPKEEFSIKSIIEKRKEWLDENEGDLEKWVFIHDRPFRLQALVEKIYDGLEFSGVFIADVYIDSENPHVNIDTWKMLFSIHPIYMNEEEVVDFNELEDEIMIYRAGDIKGISWTTNKDTAIWFSNRWSKSEIIHEKLIKKTDCKAYLTRNGENEVIYF